jgi:hypothetical protein
MCYKADALHPSNAVGLLTKRHSHTQRRKEGICSEAKQVGSNGGYHAGAVDSNGRRCYSASRVWVGLKPMELLVACLLLESPNPCTPLGTRAYTRCDVTNPGMARRCPLV